MFTQDWFKATGKDNFERYITGLSGEFLEIGCYEGRATCWMLNHTRCNITVIDTFQGSPEMLELGIKIDGIKQRFMDNTRQWKRRITILEGRSQDVLKTLDKQFNFIYVDGSHYAGDALRDIVIAWDLLRINGIMIMDDYTWGCHDAQVAQMAIDSFLTCCKGEYELLAKNAQCVVKRVRA